MLKRLYISTFYQLLIFFRVKQGVFFAIVFSVYFVWQDMGQQKP